jgi:hypothetical protein
VGGAAGLSIAAAAILGKVVGSALLATGVPVLLVGGAFIGFRAIFAAKDRSRQRILNQLLDKITDELTLATDTSGD